MRRLGEGISALQGGEDVKIHRAFELHGTRRPTLWVESGDHAVEIDQALNFGDGRPCHWGWQRVDGEWFET
jgi:hypothetical protein